MSAHVEILIVEDKEDTATILKVLLKRHGYEAVGVASKKEAIEFFTTHPDLKAVIIDVQLPDGNGIDLIKEVRDRYPLCKVIITSGFDEEHWIDGLNEVQPYHVIMKPIDFAKLRSELPDPDS